MKIEDRIIQHPYKPHKDKWIKYGDQNRGYYILITPRLWIHPTYFYLAVRYGLIQYVGRKITKFGIRTTLPLKFSLKRKIYRFGMWLTS